MGSPYKMTQAKPKNVENKAIHITTPNNFTDLPPANSNFSS